VAKNFFSLIESTARDASGRPAIVWDGGSLTARELTARVGGAARALAARGVRPGDAVAIALPNDWRFVVALLASLKLGATATPLNPLLRADERTDILADLAPALAMDDVVLEDGEWPTVSEVHGPAVILYTSGSTGRPKGAMLGHPALEWAARSWAGPVMDLQATDVVLAALPLAHSLGLNGALLAPLVAGATVVLLDRFAPEAVLAAIERHRVTLLPGVATMFRRLLDTPALDRTDHSSLRLALSGAAPCPWELAQEWRERTGVRLLRGYGMTELFRPISYLARNPSEVPESIGRPVPGVDIRVVDEDGTPLGPGEVGELLIRTPCAMDGYLGAPDATAAVLEDGWFRTGDLARIGDEGFVCIVGRRKELILRGGYSVFPQEVERVLATHAAVAEVAVIGIPDEELGEEVAAFVALRTAAMATVDELIAHCRKRLAGYKYPRRVAIVDRLPRTATGKVLKSELTRLSASLFEGAGRCPASGPTTG
jgi:long-chain acyl-CoA synthetase